MNNENDIIFDFPFHLHFCSSSYQIHRKIINLAVAVVAAVVVVAVAAEGVPSDEVN